MKKTFAFRYTSLFFLFMLMTVPLLLSQGSPAVEFSTQIGGWPDHACIVGDYAYLIQARQITVLDISGEKIEKVGSVLLEEEPMRIYSLGTHMAVFTMSSDSGLQIFNIENPESPRLCSKMALPTDWPLDLVQNGSVHYVVSGDYFHVLNLTNPNAPAIIKTLSIQSGQCVECSRDYVYVGTADSLIIYEGYDDPVWKKSLPFLSIQDMVTFSIMLYLGADEGPDKQLVALSIEDPLNPFQVSVDVPSHKEGVTTWIKNPQLLAIQYPTLFLGCEGGDACLMTYDLTDIYHPVRMGYLKIGDQSYIQINSLDISGGDVYMTTASSWALSKINISDPINPVLSGLYKDIHTVQCFAAVHDTIFASSSTTLFMYRLFDPENPVLIASNDRFGDMFRMAAGPGFLCGVKEDSLCILDVRDPANIRMTGHLTFNGNQIRGVEVKGDQVFVSVFILGADGLLAVIDISDKANPVILKNHTLPGTECGTLYVSEDGKRVMTGFFKTTGGVQILDMMNPSTPQVLGTFPVSGIPIAVTALDTLAFAASFTQDGKWYLESFSMANPTNPKRLSVRTGTGSISDVEIIGSLVTASIQGSIDPAEDTDSPVRFEPVLESDGRYSLLLKEAGSLGGGGQGGGLFFFDPFNLNNLLYILQNVFYILILVLGFLALYPLILIGMGHMNTDGLNLWGSLGLLILALVFGGINSADFAQQPSVYGLANYPNPFNPETTIQFNVNESCHVKLEVFDLRGRLVATPVNEFRSQGVHTVRFEARDLPSGIYTTQLQVGEIREARKIMLVR